MNLIGKGIYSITRASRLSGVSTGRIRRWMRGYNSSRGGAKTRIESLFHGEYENERDIDSISFLDLVEVLFIDALRKHGFSLQQIRYFAERSRKLFETEHPFAAKRLYTNGTEVFLRILQSDKSSDLIALRKQQYEIDSVVIPSLSHCIDFNTFDMAERWWPNGRDGGVVVSPDCSFGKPVVEGFRVPTSVLFDLNRSGRSVSEISEWYELPIPAIEKAIKFEQNLAV